MMKEYAFSQMRDIQIDVIERIEEAFKSYKYVMLESPTGTGKSAIAMSLALQEQEAFIITSSKFLQDQYLRDFAFSNTIKGRSNFECINPDSALSGMISCKEGACTHDKYNCSVKPVLADYDVFNKGIRNEERINYNPKPREVWDDSLKEYVEKSIYIKNRCKYFEQKYIGLAAGYTILNYKYFLSMAFYSQMELHRRKILIMDEAHNIENQILDFISINPNPAVYSRIAKDVFDDFLSKNIKLPVVPTDSLIESWLVYLKSTEKWMEDVKNYYGPAKVFAELEDVLNRVSHIASLIEQEKENWIVDTQKGVKISPIEVGKYVKPLFDYGYKVLFVSATLLDKEVFAGMVGVPAEQIKFIKVENSPFPVSNRSIILKNVGDMSYKTMDGLMPAIVGQIDTILQNHTQERGIIHTTSYKQLEYIIKNSEYKNRLIRTESGIPVSDIMRKASSISNAVLISPSLYEGVDLKDDLSRFQILIKIPFMDLSDKRTAIKARRSPSWYRWNAILKLVQGVGRSIRSENDYAVTYILDSKARYMLYDYMTPKYIQDSIIK